MNSSRRPTTLFRLFFQLTPADFANLTKNQLLMANYLVRAALTILAVSFLFMSIGCNLDSRPKRAPVSGTVTYRNQPVKGAVVNFVPVAGDNIATGLTDAQGKYQLGTFELTDGALVGQHKVSIVARGPERDPKPSEMVGMMPGTKVPGDPIIPQKYFTPDTSGLTFEVTRQGSKQADFQLQD